MGTTHDNDDRALERLISEQADARVRRVWHEGRWWFSVVDVIALLTDSPDPGAYWRKLKQRMLADEGAAETVTKCHTLKMRAADGKQRQTDAADTETLLRIIQSVPSPKAEPFKQWLARTGARRLEELENPAVAADSLRLLYRKKGYSDEWIEARLQSIMARDELTAEWRARGAEEGHEFAILTDVLHRGTFDLTTAKHRAVKYLHARDNLRDSMTTLELALTTLAEATSTTLHQARGSQGFLELQRDAGEAGEVAGSARAQIETRSGQPVVSPTNAKQLRQERQRELQPPLLPPNMPEDDAGDA